MSRNLLSTSCNECPGGAEHIVLEGPIRPVTAEEDPHYYEEHEGLLIAEARCVLCHTMYFAWVDWPSTTSHVMRGHLNSWSLAERRKYVPEARFCDLSYRSTFDDEPGAADLPAFTVERVVSYRRRVRELGSHPYERLGVKVDEANAFLKRRSATLARIESIADELARLAKASG